MPKSNFRTLFLIKKAVFENEIHLLKLIKFVTFFKNKYNLDVEEYNKQLNNI